MTKAKVRPTKGTNADLRAGGRSPRRDPEVPSTNDRRDLTDYFAAKARDNGRRIPMGEVHRKVG